MPRMKILNATEQESFDKPPVFNSGDRKRFFDIPLALFDAAQRLRTPCHQIGFLLTCGYFRAAKKFFSPHGYHPRDITYVARHLNMSPECFSASDIPETTRRRHRENILVYYGFRGFGQDAESYIAQEISEMVRAQLKPKLIFWRCVDLLTKKRFSLPSCFQLSEIILTTLNQRKHEIAVLIDRELTQDTRSLLDNLFAQEPPSAAVTDTSQYSRYRLTLLKKLSQSTKPTKVKERVDDLFCLQELYGHLEGIFPVLELGHKGIRYYAKSVIKSDIFHLSRRSDEDRYVHVIAFIAHQFYRLQDNLADVLLTVTQSYQNTASREHRDWCYENRQRRDQSLKSLLGVLDDSVFNALADIRSVLDSHEITDAEKLTHIEKLVATSDKAVERSVELKASLEQITDDRHYFEILENRSLRLQNRISPIVKALDFQAELGAIALIEAIAHFKDKDGNVTKYAPLDFLDAEQCAAVNDGGMFHTSLYKAFLFIHIAFFHQIRDGKSETLS